MNSDSQPAPTVPVHLGLILDGNRRWAKAQGLPRFEGHRRGYENLHAMALAAAERGVRYVSAYVFSTENWERTQDEVDYLMGLLLWVATKEVDKYLKEGLKMVFLGSRTRLSPKILRAMDAAEEKTKGGTTATVAICLNYGGQLEISEAAAQMVREGVAADDITPERFEQYLYHPEVPPIDLLVRSSGEQRLSGFMLFRASYAELYFVPQPWPAFSVTDLDEALAEYGRRQRRFGA